MALSFCWTKLRLSVSSFLVSLADSFSSLLACLAPTAKIPYKTLASTISEIRLITLLPGEPDSRICCEIKHASLNDAPQFEALSYEWGSRSNPRRISVHGHRISVTENLHAALNNLRYPRKSRTLWVDALCINQDNILERNDQVRLMARIYSTAHRVVAWVGTEAQGGDDAIALIEDIRDHFQLDLDHPVHFSPHGFRAIGFDPDTKNWSALLQLFQSTYFTRVWVIQELHFAGYVLDSKDQCLFGYGNHWIPRTWLTNAWLFLIYVANSRTEFIKDVGLYGRGDPSGLAEPARTLYLNNNSAMHRMFDILITAYKEGLGQPQVVSLPKAYMAFQSVPRLCFPELFQSDPPKSRAFAQLLRLTCNFNATDPRDKIYALLGMIGDDGKEFPVDYTRSLQEVWREAVSFSITKSRNLEILETNREYIDPHVPSWMTSWLSQLKDGASWSQRSLYRTSADLGAVPPRFSDDGKVLYVKGLTLGTVASCMIPSADVDGVENLELWFEIFRTCLFLYNRSFGPEHQQAFWRTLLMDQDQSIAGKPKLPASESQLLKAATLFNELPVPEYFEPDSQPNVRRDRFTMPFVHQIDDCLKNRCFFVTNDGCMGIGPSCTQKGDVVAVLLGGAHCFLLRPKDKQYQLVGNAYVHGMMQGQSILVDIDGEVVGAKEIRLC